MNPPLHLIKNPPLCLMIFDDDIILENRVARLEPLTESHRALLADVASDSLLWEFVPNPAYTPEGWKRYMDTALQLRAEKKRYPFVIIDQQSGRYAGSSSYGNLSITDHRIEIGWSWIGTDFWGTDLNTACKFLLLSFAFDKMDLHRVELKTDVRNQRSRKSILKLGAQEEGVLRSHMSLQDGSRRDSVYYSILRDEWSEVRLNLLNRIDSKKYG